MHRRLEHLAGIPWVANAAPWVGVLLLNVLFVAPLIGKLTPRKPWLLLQPSGDLAVLLIAYVAATRWRWRHARWVRALLATVGVILWLFSWDIFVVSTLFRHTPPLYDQTYLLRHLGVLAFDLWSYKLALALLAAGLAVGTVVGLARLLLRKSTQALAARPLSHTLPITVILMLVLGVGTVLDRNKTTRRRNSVLWLAPILVRNLDHSLQMYRALERGITHSPYAGYAERYPLSRKPDVQLFLVESYGRILMADPVVGPGWVDHAQDIQGRLEEAGWHMVTGYSQAPVSGGRSWLAEATLLTGIWVPYEAMFQQMLGNIERTPNLVSYLDSQGYETILLAPKDRPRPGVEMENRYRYDQQIVAPDLEYDGPGYGWGVIPDEYSLGFAHDNVWSKVDGPIFTNFHMVSSHAPWQVVPEVVDDWRSIADRALPDETDAHQFISPERELWERARHYRRAWTRNAYMGDADSLNMGSFATSIHYDLEILARHLLRLEGDKLVIIMGDHQPPLLSSADDSYDVPVHILARDDALLGDFRELGFVDGLVVAPTYATSVSHAGVFSLLVRALVRCCSTTDLPLPRHVPDGVRPMKLRR
ncbi:MAG: hypothetical protein AAF721_22460 [Myxococcota bacterium]